MNMLLMVEITDSYKRLMEDKLERIHAINDMIGKLKQEKALLAIDLDHMSNLLEGVIKDKDYTDNNVESVIERNKGLIKRCRSVAESISSNK